MHWLIRSWSMPSINPASQPLPVRVEAVLPTRPFPYLNQNVRSHNRQDFVGQPVLEVSDCAGIDAKHPRNLT